MASYSTFVTIINTLDTNISDGIYNITEGELVGEFPASIESGSVAKIQVDPENSDSNTLFEARHLRTIR